MSPNSSTNPFNGNAYELPQVRDDRLRIDLFLKKNKDKPVIVIQGLGFVGGVMSLVCANSHIEDYAVIGLDLPTVNSYWKIGSFNEGILPLKSSDPKVSEYFQEARSKDNFYATFDASAISHADVVIVDVNFDVVKTNDESGLLKEFDVDLEPFSSAIKTIASNCKPDALILIETTVPPGTSEKIVYPLVKQGLENRNLQSDLFKLGHSYERVMPGPKYIDSIKNFFRVYSGIDNKSADATEAFLKTIISTEEYPLTRLQGTNSTEIAKVLENSYRAMNISFMVEWTRFAEEAGVDIYEIVNAIRQRDTHRNLMLPGLGVGGYCLSKDPLLASWARKNMFNSSSGLTQSEHGVRINDQMPLFAFNFLCERLGDLKLKGLKVLLLGVSYRGDVGDTRYSPVELFYNLLNESGSEIMVHDFFVEYWSECDLKVHTDLNSFMNNDFDIIAITAGHSAYRNNSLILEKLNELGGKVIFDTLGFMSKEEISYIEQRNQVHVLGKGN
jgi:nucleotide sugar dehydrogenase